MAQALNMHIWVISKVFVTQEYLEKVRQERPGVWAWGRGGGGTSGATAAGLPATLNLSFCDKRQAGQQPINLCFHCAHFMIF